MDRKKQIAALTDDEGERLLLAQACERLTRAEQRGIPAATVFLTPREQALLRQLLPQCRFWGGTPDAERAVAYWLPEYEDEDDYRENGPVACLRAAFFEENAVGHRDMLGALMAAASAARPSATCACSRVNATCSSRRSLHRISSTT